MNFDGDEVEVFAVLNALNIVQSISSCAPKKGTRGKKRQMIRRDRKGAHKMLRSDYLFDVEYRINSASYSLPYWLADGIYPDMRIFVKTFSNPETETKAHFAGKQVAVRKDIERVFGVLKAKFKFLASLLSFKIYQILLMPQNHVLYCTTCLLSFNKVIGPRLIRISQTIFKMLLISVYSTMKRQ